MPGFGFMSFTSCQWPIRFGGVLKCIFKPNSRIIVVLHWWDTEITDPSLVAIHVREEMFH